MAPAPPALKGVLFVVNPAAGSGRAAAVWSRLQRADPGVASARVLAEPTSDATRRALRAALEDRPERVVAVGGDGTVNLVAATLLELGLGSAVALGIAPAGTGSDLARSLGLPRNPAAALRLALSGPTRRIDVIALERGRGVEAYAVNVASAGLSGAVNAWLDARPPGQPKRYLAGTVRALVGYRPLSARLEVDGDPWFEGPVFLCALANGRMFGRGMRVAPRAELDDGLLDLIVVGDLPKWQLTWRLPLLLAGRHLGMRVVRWCRGARVRLQPLEPFPDFELDGERVAAGEVVFEVQPKALRVVAPEGNG